MSTTTAEKRPREEDADAVERPCKKARSGTVYVTLILEHVTWSMMHTVDECTRVVDTRSLWQRDEAEAHLRAKKIALIEKHLCNDQFRHRPRFCKYYINLSNTALESYRGTVKFIRDSVTRERRAIGFNERAIEDNLEELWAEICDHRCPDHAPRRYECKLTETTIS